MIESRESHVSWPFVQLSFLAEDNFEGNWATRPGGVNAWKKSMWMTNPKLKDHIWKLWKI